MLKILHTSDWHLGAMLAGEERIEEQKQFLDWLGTCIIAEKIDVLLVTGDIFDTYTPPVNAQNAYYKFLAGLLFCESLKAVFITGGNHDSPAFLSAPSELLNHLNIHVVSSLEMQRETEQNVPGHNEAGQPLVTAQDEDLNEEKMSAGDLGGVFEVKDAEGKTALIVCAVPFLREKDLRISGGIDDETDLTEKTRQALAAVYKSVFEQAEKIAHNDTAAGKIPIVITGHLYAAGSILSDNNSERARDVGRLSAFPAALLPDAGYIALGHLHKAQAVGGNEFCRYSGAPLPMSFSEVPFTALSKTDSSAAIGKIKGRKNPAKIAHNRAHNTGEDCGGQKSAVIVEFTETPRIRLVDIPEFRRLVRLHGAPAEIMAELAHLDEEAWVEVQVTQHDGPLLDFWNALGELSRQNKYKILIKQDMRESTCRVLEAEAGVELQTLLPPYIFEQRLKDEQLNEDDTAEYVKMFSEIYDAVITGSMDETVPAVENVPEKKVKLKHQKKENMARKTENVQISDAQAAELA